ncbi:MAG TPA: PssD/Cps14F family polysaccharide biosynthesis glycosyltransferase [Candidatus Limnocylindrales bacterium]
MTRSRPVRVALVGSSGGHLLHLHVLAPFWRRYDRFWVTFRTADAESRLKGERVHWCFHPTNRNVPNLVRNTLLAIAVLVRERPTHIVSTGAAVAVPFFWLGRLFGATTIYLEVIDRIDSPTLTGRLVAPVTSRFLVQWPEQLRLYPGATLVGPIL